MKNDKMIFGLHSISEAFEAGKEIDKIFIRRGLKTEQTEAIIREACGTPEHREERRRADHSRREG